MSSDVPSPATEVLPQPPTLGRGGINPNLTLGVVAIVALLLGVIIGIFAGPDGATTVASEPAPAETVTVTASARPPSAARTVTVTATVTPSQEQTTVAPPPPPPPPPTTAPAGDTLTDDGWTVETFSVSDSGIGTFGASARIRNGTASAVQGALFTLTVLDGGAIIATMSGAAQGVAAGGVATVQFVGLDPYIDGDFTYAFQVDGTY